MSEDLSRCEIARAWTEQRGYPLPVEVWRPKPAQAPLRYDGPKTLQEMIAAHKARQARHNEAVLAKKLAAFHVRWAAKQERERIQLEFSQRAEERRRAYEAEATKDELSVIQHPSMRRIIRAVSNEFGISVVDIISHRRTATFVLPRQVAMYLCKVTTPHSLPTIAKQFDGRDHTTILHGVRTTAARMAANDAFRARA